MYYICSGADQRLCFCICRIEKAGFSHDATQITNAYSSHDFAHPYFREREKAEIKDRKVLEILQMKDEKIEELQAILTSRARELEDSISRWVKHVTLNNKEGIRRLIRDTFPFVYVYEPRCEKTGLRVFRPGPTQTGLYSHRICLDA